MALFDWDPRFSTGIDKFDEEHKKLIGLIRDLNKIASDGTGSDEVGGVLDELVSYTETHFASEEAAMEAHDYPDFVAHKGKHVGFVTRLGELRRGFAAGEELITLEVLSFLQEWVAAHIMEEDKRYGPFLSERA